MMRNSASTLTLLIAMVSLAGFSGALQAGGIQTDTAYQAQPRGHVAEHSTRAEQGSSDYRLRPGFALSYGVAGTNIGNPRYFEEPRTRTYGSTPSRLGPGGVYDRSTRSEPQRQGHGQRHGQSGDRYSRGYRDGYRDGQRDSRQGQRHSVGPGR